MSLRRSLLALLLCVTCQAVRANDWPKWLGAEHDGVWREAGIVEDMPDELIKRWSVPVNGGYSGPAVSGNRVVVMDFVKKSQGSIASLVGVGAVEGTERILCFDRDTGEEVWQHSYETALKVSYPGGPRITPCIDQERVYVQGTMGDLICLDTASGKVIWQRQVATEYETKPPIWGYASHPLIVGDSLFCTAGGEESGVIAVDKLTGETKWSAITAQEIGYAPLVAAEICGKQQLVVWYDEALAGLDLNSGALLWSYKFPKEKPQRPIVSIVPPKVIQDRIYITNFYHGSALVEIVQTGEGYQANEVWTTEKIRPVKGYKPEINSIMSSVLYQDNCLFGVAGNGELRCVDIESSEVLWRSYQSLATTDEDPLELPRGFKGFASMFMTPQADRNWLFTDQGDLILARLTKTGYEELGRSNLLATTGKTRGRSYVWCHPAYANRCIFVRNEKELACFDLSADAYSSSAN